MFNLKEQFNKFDNEINDMIVTSNYKLMNERKSIDKNKAQAEKYNKIKEEIRAEVKKIFGGTKWKMIRLNTWKIER